MSRFDLQATCEWHPQAATGSVAARTARLAQLLGIANRPKPPMIAEKLQSADCGSYVEEKYSLDVGDGVEAPMYILVPKTEPPYTPILAFHGHDPSVQYILGHYPDEDTAKINYSNHNNYAQALAEAGYLVCAVEQRGMGERLTAQTNEAAPRSCRHLAFSYMMQGRTLLGDRCWDGICAVNYLQTRADVCPDILGCTGHSGGGTTALFLTALDPRIMVSVVSGYFCAYHVSILGMPHCECNYVPGLLTLGDIGEIAALIAPRPLCLVNGAKDPIFPAHGAVAQFPIVENAYEKCGHAEACQLFFHAGEHAYHMPTALDWFERWLTPQQ